MNRNSKTSKVLYLIPIGIAMAIPEYVNFIANGKGNAVDWLFFYMSLAGYSLFVLAAFLGYKKKG